MTSFSAISDTHGNEPDLMPADVGIHSGDFTIHGFRVELARQLCWLEMQRSKFQHAFAVLGNHDLHAEKHLEAVRKMFADVGWTLLHNESFILPNGLKIYGSPHTPNYHNWAFMLGEEEIKKAWDKIPDGTNVVITHGPPQGILDMSYRGRIGCPWLRKRIELIRPELHFFGHAHPIDKGLIMSAVDHRDNTTYINAATRNIVVRIP